MITFGVHQSSPFTAKNGEQRRSGLFEYVCQCMAWANCTQFLKKEGLLGWGERALTALPFKAALSSIHTHKGCARRGRCMCVCVCVGDGKEGPLFVFPATEKVPGESGCVSDLMSYPGSAPRAPSKSAAWESSGDSALLSGPRGLTYSIQTRSLWQCLALFLSQVRSQYLNTHTHNSGHTPSAYWLTPNRRRERGVKQSITKQRALFGETDSEKEEISVRWSCTCTMAANWASLTAKLPTGFIVSGQCAAAWHCMPPTSKG